MALTKVKLQNFTAFEDLAVEFSPGVNAFIGANGTGKTHLMKVCYAACNAFRAHDIIGNELLGAFLPSGRQLGRLVKQPASQASTAVYAGDREVSIVFDTRRTRTQTHAGLTIASAYIPPKEMLANAPGFLSLYAAREVHFEEVYRDILHRAYLPALREPIDDTHVRMLEILEKVIGGKITVKGEEFFLSNEQGDLEFTLLAEGWRKLGLLWLLIRNGTLQKGSVLFWDEPEGQPEPQDVPGGDRCAAGIAAGRSAGLLRHPRLRHPQGT